MMKKICIIVGAILVTAGLIIGGIGLKKYLDEKNAGATYEELKEQLDVEPLVEIPHLDETIENPIDFATLKAQYPDIYAWIRVPGTNIDYPIVQHPTDNSYYINHTIEGKKRIAGAIFTENYNSKDFNDPNTLIYGHNMKNGSMFKTLHKYKDKKFFEENREVFIYQEGKVLRYRIFAAYMTGDTHILFEYDMHDPNIFRIYLNNVLTNKSMSSNIDTKVEVSENDKIITLCTCDYRDDLRYLVQAVLISIQE